MAYYIVSQDDYLFHHGIKGQRWGIRRKNGNKQAQKGSTLKRGASAVIKVLSMYINNKSNIDSFIRSGKMLVEKSNVLSMNLQRFASSNKNTGKPYKFKNKQEAAIVNHAFNSDVSKEDKRKPRLTKDINIDNQGAFSYSAVNLDGRGTFQVRSRTRIKDSATGILERRPNKK